MASISHSNIQENSSLNSSWHCYGRRCESCSSHNIFSSDRKTVFATLEAAFGFHTDCNNSYILSHLPGKLGEYLALTRARLDGAEMIAIGLATRYVPSEKFPKLEKLLTSLNSGDKDVVKATIEEFSIQVQPGEKSILHNCSLIEKCFSKDTVEAVIEYLVNESNREGNE